MNVGAGTNHEDEILIIEDEEHIQRLIATTLERAGYRIIVASDGSQGLRAFFQNQPDLVILDMMLPGIDGWELCRRIREVSEAPIVILSAAGREDDKVRGLEAGADDYVLKPFGGRELVARIAATLRRARTTIPEREEQVYSDGRLRLDYKLHEVRVNGVPVVLSPTEFRLLSFLVRNRNQVLTYDQLLERVWGDESESFGSLKQYVSRLRTKLGDESDNPYVILTVRGTGYRYVRQE